jgi:hypothetical protein
MAPLLARPIGHELGFATEVAARRVRAACLEAFGISFEEAFASDFQSASEKRVWMNIAQSILDGARAILDGDKQSRVN